MKLSYKIFKFFSFILIHILIFIQFSIEIEKSSNIFNNKSDLNNKHNAIIEIINNKDFIIKSKNINLHYYNQTDIRWANKIYGEDDIISIYGCGPTVLSMIVSSMTNDNITPDKMAEWSYLNGYFCNNSGSYHSIIPLGLSQWGLNIKPMLDYSKQNLLNTISNGNIIVALMGNGHFTQTGHFIIIRDISENSKLLIADPLSLENSLIEWEPEIILNEAKYSASNDGPFWIISK